MPSASPRFFLRAPPAGVVAAFRREQAMAAFAYPAVGGTSRNEPPPAGFDLDHNRVCLGRGDAVFTAACAALRAWEMFPRPWTQILPANAAIGVGETLIMQAQAVGFYWLNACRIVYLLEDVAPVRRFGFAYGTLPAHVEAGEERFSVEQLDDGTVWYDLRAFSRPRFWPVRLAKPIARRLQRRFVRDSQAAMRRVTAAATGPVPA